MQVCALMPRAVRHASHLLHPSPRPPPQAQLKTEALPGGQVVHLVRRLFDRELDNHHEEVVLLAQVGGGDGRVVGGAVVYPPGGPQPCVTLFEF